MRTCWALGLLALLARGAGAQTIGGKVLEDSTRVPISGATVSVLRLGEQPAARVEPPGSVRTDSAGGFVLALGAPGRFVLRITHPSYTTVQSDTLVLEKDEVVSVELRLARYAIPLKPLVVTARTDRRLQAFRQRVLKHYAFGHFLPRAEIDRRPGIAVTELLRGVPGVRIMSLPPCAGCAAENVLFLRGGGAADRCLATVLIDGMEVKQEASFPLDAALTPDMVEGVEVYVEPAGVPAQLGFFHNNACGVIAFWTRPVEGGKLTWKRLLIPLAAAALLLYLLW